MYIYSEKTKRRYETVEECIKAEEEYDKALAEEKEKKERLASERRERAKEVENAFKEANDLLKAFIKDYGSFHTTYNSTFSPIRWFDLWR